MKKLLSAAALSLIAAVIFVSCAKSPEMTVDVIKTKDGTSLTVRSGTEQRSFSVEEGQSCEVFVTVKKAGGTLDLKIESADGEKIVSNRNILVNRYDSNVNYATVDDIAVDIADGVYNFKPDYDKEERKYKGFTIKLDGEEYTITSVKDILAVVED